MLFRGDSRTVEKNFNRRTIINYDHARGFYHGVVVPMFKACAWMAAGAYLAMIAKACIDHEAEAGASLDTKVIEFRLQPETENIAYLIDINEGRYKRG